MSDLSSLNKFLSKENIGLIKFEDNYVWRHHGEMWETYYRDRAIFGDKIDDINKKIAVSQYMQAEGLKYIIESDRRRAFYNGGLMVWCFNEPFPNVSNTCIVDYYGNKKPAYYQVKKCYENAYASFTYTKLVWGKGENIVLTPYVINSNDGDFSLKIKVYKDEDLYNSFEFKGSSKKDIAKYLEEIIIPVGEEKSNKVHVELNCKSQSYKGMTMLLCKDKDGFAYIEPVFEYISYLKD